MHSQKSPPDWLGLLILTLPPLFWAGNFVFGRAVHTTLPPFTLSLSRWVIATIIIMPFAWKHLRQDKELYWQYRWRILGVGLLGAATFNALIYLGLQSTTATNGVLLNSTSPLLIVLWGVLFYKHHTNLLQITGMIVSFIGVIFIVSQGNWQYLLSLSFSKGDFIILTAAICWSVFTLWLRVLPPQMNKVGLSALQFIIAAVIMSPFAFAEYMGGSKPIWTPLSLLAVVYIGLFPSVLAFILYSLGVMRAGAARAGLFLHLMPVFGALLSSFFLKENLHIYHLIGITSIFTGIALSTYGAKRISSQ